MPGAQVISHRQRRPGELAEHRLPVQRQVVDLACQPHLVLLG